MERYTQGGQTSKCNKSRGYQVARIPKQCRALQRTRQWGRTDCVVVSSWTSLESLKRGAEDVVASLLYDCLKISLLLAPVDTLTVQRSQFWTSSSSLLFRLQARIEVSVGSATMGSLVRPIAGRAMHLHIIPRPSNLGESREVMRLVSQFGEIDYYKNLKYDEVSQPRSALVIFKDEQAANECLRRSPVRFRMGKATSPAKTEEIPSEDVQSPSSSSEVDSEASRPRGPTGAPFGLGTQTRSMSTSHHQLPKPPRNNMRAYMPFESPPEAPAITESRIFEIKVNRSSRHFRDRVNQSHYHGPFAIDTKMVGHGDLAKKVPTPGLSCVDWKAMEKPWHVIQTEKDRDKKGVTARRRLGLLWEERETKDPEDDKSHTTKESEFGII